MNSPENENVSFPRTLVLATCTCDAFFGRADVSVKYTTSSSEVAQTQVALYVHRRDDRALLFHTDGVGDVLTQSRRQSLKRRDLAFRNAVCTLP
ncbi:hypothetical protein PI124_g16241 [Phytophthora idaei]|nr:hypothetical protein PI126_g15434 [Phytophthora idaei]KAG3238815.1 hypothetical protein PI124_g16241 [Phytophthora idaei]